MKRFTANQGFTIVELLVVVVVIAILATITVAGYQGITAQAKNTQRTAAADTWLKALQLYKAEHGTYPKVPSPYIYDNWCLGTTLEATPRFPEWSCVVSNGTVVFESQSGYDLRDMLKPLINISESADPSPIIVSEGGQSVAIRGLSYIGSTTNGTLGYYLEGDATCVGGATKEYNGGYTHCIIQLD